MEQISTITLQIHSSLHMLQTTKIVLSVTSIPLGEIHYEIFWSGH